MTVERRDTTPPVTAYDDVWRLAQRIANTEFVPAGLRGRPEAVLACILTGRALGVDEMVALANIDVINGRPDTSAELMRALVKNAGHTLIWEASDGEHATLTGVRADDRTALTLTWKLEDAERAGLIKLVDGKPVAKTAKGDPLPWMSYTRVMLRERVTKELCRTLFADVLAGLTPDIRDTSPDLAPVVDAEPVGEVVVNLDGSVDIVGPDRPELYRVTDDDLDLEAGPDDDGPDVVPVGVTDSGIGDPDRDDPE